SGHFREAIKQLRRALLWWRRSDDEEYRASGTALTQLFLSLAHYRLGEVEEARQRLKDGARGIARANSQGEGKGKPGSHWNTWAACQVVRREAEGLVKGKVQGPGR